MLEASVAAETKGHMIEQGLRGPVGGRAARQRVTPTRAPHAILARVVLRCAPWMLVLLSIACESSPPPAPRVARASSLAYEPAPRLKPQPPPEPPFRHADDVEYQNGLAFALEAAPVIGHDVVTNYFRWGYLVGVGEAIEFETYFDGLIQSAGCALGLTAQLEAGVNLTAPTKTATGVVPYETQRAICLSMQKIKEMPPTHGKLYSRERLKAAEQASRATDPREVSIEVNIFTVAYSMGFAHHWERVDREARVETLFKEACRLGLKAEGLSTTAAASIATSCAQKAAEARETHGPGLRCLLASKELNGELSGAAFKPGCPRRE